MEIYALNIFCCFSIEQGCYWNLNHKHQQMVAIKIPLLYGCIPVVMWLHHSLPSFTSIADKQAYHEPRQWFIVGTKKVMGENHKVNSPKVSHNFLNDDGTVFVKLFKKLLWNFLKIYSMEFSSDWLTNCLPAWCLQTCV